MLHKAAIYAASILMLCACGSPRPPASSAEKCTSGDDAARRHTAAWQEGVHYQAIATPRDSKASNEIELLEFFSYACGHCYVFEPYAVMWAAQKPERVQFERVPALRNDIERSHARLYYVLQALGREDLHHEVYDTMYRLKDPLYSPDGARTFESQLRFAVKHGVHADDFKRAYQSPEVEAALARADRLAREYKIDSTPAVVIGGVYKSNATMAGGEQALFLLMRDAASGKIAMKSPRVSG